MLFGEKVQQYFRLVDKTAKEYYKTVRKLKHNEFEGKAQLDNSRLSGELIAAREQRVQVFLPDLQLDHKA